MRILFFGGHELGKITLKALINENKNVIGAVISKTNNKWYKGVDEVALEYGIPLYEEKDINSDEFVNKVTNLNPELIISVNFNQIFKKEVIQIPDKGCINTHASLLPKYRGRAPLNWAIINGEKETGVTVHYIDEGIDTGDIIIQKKINIDHTDYIGDILNKIKKLYPVVVNEAVDLIENNKVKPIKQKNQKGSYFGKRTPKDGQIKWNKSTVEIYNLIRAVSHPYPGAYSFLNGNKIIIWKAKIAKTKITNQAEKLQCGKIVELINNKPLVKTLDGFILIQDYECNSNVSFNRGDSFVYRKDG